MKRSCHAYLQRWYTHVRGNSLSPLCSKPREAGRQSRPNRPPGHRQVLQASQGGQRYSQLWQSSWRPKACPAPFELPSRECSFHLLPVPVQARTFVPWT